MNSRTTNAILGILKTNLTAAEIKLWTSTTHLHVYISNHNVIYYSTCYRKEEVTKAFPTALRIINDYLNYLLSLYFNKNFLENNVDIYLKS